MDERKEIEDKIYEKYLTDKLDLIFNGETGKSSPNELRNIVDEPVEVIPIKTKNGINLIGPTGYPLQNVINLQKIHNFQNGYAIVEKNDKYNFINTEGNLISNEWFDNVEDFHEGYAVVEKNDKYNFINTEGNLISSEWLSYKIHSFHENYAKVQKAGSYNFINTKGNLISNEWYDDVEDFHEGYAVVVNRKYKNYINTEGKLMFNEWLDYAYNFHEGFARVVINNKFNIINTKKELISPEWFDGLADFHEGYAIVIKNKRCNFINTQGNLISNEWLNNAYNFHEGFARVQKNKKFNYINTKAEYISPEWFDDVEDFNAGKAKVKKNGEYYFINTEGNKIDDNEIVNNINESKTNNKVNPEIKFESIYSGLGNLKVICKNIEMGDYEVKKTLSGYICTTNTDSYKIKYEPIKTYGLRYTLCLKDTFLYLYDRFNNNYLKLCAYHLIDYDDNFIVDRYNKKVYSIYENKLLDITDYYHKYLKDKEEIRITSGISDICSKEEFVLSHLSEIEQKVTEERNRKKMNEEELQKDDERRAKENELKEIATKKSLEEQKRKEEYAKKLEKLKEILIYLEQNKESREERIKVENLFMTVDDHLEIQPIYIDLLRYIDISYETFDNVKINGIDFRGCNLGSVFNPQRIYQKNLSSCDFDKVFISPFMNFDGVDIRGCRFSEDDDPKTIDIFNTSFTDAIYDETTTYNGISFYKIFDKKDKKK